MKDEILAGIQQNMRIESVRGEAQPDAPYGPGPKAALEDALELGRKLGFKVGQADNRIGWVEYGEGKEMVGVLGHVDVVPAGDTGWTYPAYGAEIHDGILWGRGCLDDKGPIIGSIYALKAIRDLNLSIDRRIRVIFGSDEECGSSCAAYYVENGYEMPTIGFTPDADFPVIFCEKGTTGIKGGSKVYDKGHIEVEYFGGGIADNVVIPTCKLVVKGGDDKVQRQKVRRMKRKKQSLKRWEGNCMDSTSWYKCSNSSLDTVKEWVVEIPTTDGISEKIRNGDKWRITGEYTLYLDEETGMRQP